MIDHRVRQVHRFDQQSILSPSGFWNSFYFPMWVSKYICFFASTEHRFFECLSLTLYHCSSWNSCLYIILIRCDSGGIYLLKPFVNLFMILWVRILLGFVLRIVILTVHVESFTFHLFKARQLLKLKLLLSLWILQHLYLLVFWARNFPVKGYSALILVPILPLWFI